MGDEQIVRALRLEALSESPGAFESSPEEELEWTTLDWRRCLTQGATFFLEGKSEPRGFVAGIPHWSDRSTVFLMSLWVHPRFRGTGEAEALMESLLSWAEAECATEVRLHVDKRSHRARRFYEKSGFRPTGREIIRERDGVILVEMARDLRPGA